MSLFLIAACTPLATEALPAITLTPTIAPVSAATWTPSPAPTEPENPTPPPTLPAPTMDALAATLAALPTTPSGPAATLAPTGAGTALPTEVRLPPEKWQEWPIVPSITAHALAIYQKGIAMGNDPHAFSKIGDCQSVTAAFFGIYDQPGAYSLPRGYESLQQTIDWFRGSFGRESKAVKGGYNVASVLTPTSLLWAYPNACNAGETPLDCEFREHKPSIVIISMETGFSGRTPAVYEKYMRQIIDYVIAKGALPILATKADNFEGDQSINLTTAKLATEYDLPLWNFWRAVQPLPDHGMDMVRNDKFHISVEAWNVRSFTGLEALDALWRAVQ